MTTNTDPQSISLSGSMTPAFDFVIGGRTYWVARETHPDPARNGYRLICDHQLILNVSSETYGHITALKFIVDHLARIENEWKQSTLNTTKPIL
jgi:hypothetical protein